MARKGKLRPRDLSKLPYTEHEIRLKLRRLLGKVPPFRPKRGQQKSTKIAMYDIARLAHIDRTRLTRFSLGVPCTDPTRGERWFGYKTLKRICDTLDLVAAGYVTKLQHGKYIIHDEPVVAPLKEMRVSLATGKITNEVIMPPKVRKMPSFDKLFGGK